MVKVPFESLPQKLREAIVEAARSKRERWYSASMAHEVVRDQWGVLRAHPDPAILAAMKKLEEATFALADVILERYEGEMRLARDEAAKEAAKKDGCGVESCLCDKFRPALEDAPRFLRGPGRYEQISPIDEQLRRQFEQISRLNAERRKEALFQEAKALLPAIANRIAGQVMLPEPDEDVSRKFAVQLANSISDEQRKQLMTTLDPDQRDAFEKIAIAEQGRAPDDYPSWVRLGVWFVRTEDDGEHVYHVNNSFNDEDGEILLILIRDLDSSQRITVSKRWFVARQTYEITFSEATLKNAALKKEAIAQAMGALRDGRVTVPAQLAPREPAFRYCAQCRLGFSRNHVGHSIDTEKWICSLKCYVEYTGTEPRFMPVSPKFTTPR